jgi:phosphoribosylamine--glycine ligase
MNILLLGGRGREHALAWKLAQSRLTQKLFCAPGSDAISSLAECVPIDSVDGVTVAGFCAEKGIDLVVIGPESALAAGTADVLRKAGVRVLGPGREAARLESSKSFAKSFMLRHGIPTPRGLECASAEAAAAALEKIPFPLVIKADGLAGGKGVRICRDLDEAEETIDDFMQLKVLGAAGRTVIVEECLRGEELTAMALVDSRGWTLLPYARDHKRLSDGDVGPNTGGMGAFAPVDVDTRTDRAVRAVFDAAVSGLRDEGLDYRGVLYAGLMLTAQGPQVLEFNCRFGDPETQAVLPLLDCDLAALALSCAEGRLSADPIKITPGACVCVTLASENYPRAPMVGRPIRGLDELRAGPDLLIFHGATRRVGGTWTTSGGRVLGVTAIGADLASARRQAYDAVSRVGFDGMHYRRDIAGEVISLRS